MIHDITDPIGRVTVSVGDVVNIDLPWMKTSLLMAGSGNTTKGYGRCQKCPVQLLCAQRIKGFVCTPDVRPVLLEDLI